MRAIQLKNFGNCTAWQILPAIAIVFSFINISYGPKKKRVNYIFGPQCLTFVSKSSLYVEMLYFGLNTLKNVRNWSYHHPINGWDTLKKKREKVFIINHQMDLKNANISNRI